MTDRLVDADRVVPDDGRPGDTPEPAVVESVAGDEQPPAQPPSRWEQWRERRRNRVSHWDLPPHPKDWRYFVGGFGKILIATGLLMFGFVAYQLWGTGIETARAQSKLGNEFSDQIEAATASDEPAIGIDNWVVPRRPLDDPPTADDDGGGDDDGAATPETDGPVVDTPPDDVLGSGSIGEPSDVVPGGVDLTDYAVEHDVPVVPGEAFARLEIPKIGRSDYVVPGVRLNDLKKGPGHYPDTPLPGQLGNASIAGHRTTYGSPFFNVDQLEPGDELVVTMITGDRFVYRVTELQVVSAADSWVISTRDPSVAELTLTTCHPKYTARDRLIVHSVMVPEKSSQVGVAEFYELDEPETPDEPIPGDDPTFEADGGDEPTSDTDDTDDTDTDRDEVTTTLPAFDDGTVGEPDASAEPDITDEPADEPADEPDITPADEPEPEPDEGAAVADDAGAPPLADDAELDAFEQGWFDDREAFPQIALWASVLIALWVIGYQISKRFRRYSVGILVTCAPFLVALYFFYQNVNRLLPPGL